GFGGGGLGGGDSGGNWRRGSFGGFGGGWRRGEGDFEGGLDPGVLDPIPSWRNRDKAAKDWASVRVEDDSVVVRLKGWRAVLAVKWRLRVPLRVMTAVGADPYAYAHVPTSLRDRRKAHPRLWRLGVYRGFRGWSFWSCGIGRNAVVLQTDTFRFKFVVIEVADPAKLVEEISAAMVPYEARRALEGDDADDAKD
ncbi:MAG: hypothetical protein ACRDZ5_08280, partial [Acidimicrobiales bacterium]